MTSTIKGLDDRDKSKTREAKRGTVNIFISFLLSFFTKQKRRLINTRIPFIKNDRKFWNFRERSKYVIYGMRTLTCNNINRFRTILGVRVTSLSTIDDFFNLMTASL